jgi:uroporphyrinogen-III decarboxylase
MDVKKVGKEFGGKVAFRSDLDRQYILPRGYRQDIRDHVKEVIDSLGSFGGGLIGHGEIAPDIPLENIRTMLEAWREFGQY